MPTEGMIPAGQGDGRELEGLWMPGNLRELENAILEGRFHFRRNPVLMGAFMLVVTDKDR